MRQNLAGLLLKVLKSAAAILVCAIAALMPYRARRAYSAAIAAAVHFPFKAFCAVAGRIMKELGISYSDFERT